MAEGHYPNKIVTVVVVVVVGLLLFLKMSEDGADNEAKRINRARWRQKQRSKRRSRTAL